MKPMHGFLIWLESVSKEKYLVIDRVGIKAESIKQKS